MRGGVIVRALGEVAQAGRGRAGVEAVDQADRVDQAGLLHEQPLEHVDAGVEVLVDRGHDLVDRRGLLEDLADAPDHLVEARRDLAQREDRRDEVVDERQHDQRDDDDHHDRRLRTWLPLLRVVEDHVERAAVVGDPRDRLGHLVLRRQQQRGGVEVLRRRGRRPRRSAARSGRCSARALQHAVQQVDDDRHDDHDSSTTLPIHQSVIAASSRRRSRPCGRCPAGRRG